MSTFSRKLKDFLGLNNSGDYDSYEYDVVDGSEYQSYPSEHRSTTERQLEGQIHQPQADSEPPMNSSTSNVVGMPVSGLRWGTVAEVIVIQPQDFKEMPHVVQALRERKSVVLNLTMMDPEQAQRAVDFVAGATFTIDGHQERIGESIFLFTPSCVQVSTQPEGVQETPQPQIHRPPAASWTGEPVVSRYAAQ